MPTQGCLPSVSYASVKSIVVAPAHFLLHLQVQDTLQQRCHALQKLGAVLELLTKRLAAIVEDWESGALSKAGLSLREVAGLVQALFEDTDYRAVCLQRMEAAAEAV